VRISFSEVGFTIGLNYGKLFSVIGPNPNSGILLKGGGGYIQHNIKIKVNGKTIPMLNGEILDLYDRRVNGWFLNEFIGYQHLSNNGFFNFYVGFNLKQGFTTTTRDYNIDSRKKIDTKTRSDLFYGIQLGWILPLYNKSQNNFFYN
ncbi:MAG: hypothetical protein ABEH43_08235, partial [Flavobacteriales bacterium]